MRKNKNKKEIKNNKNNTTTNNNKIYVQVPLRQNCGQEMARARPLNRQGKTVCFLFNL